MDLIVNLLREGKKAYYLFKVKNTLFSVFPPLILLFYSMIYTTEIFLISSSIAWLVGAFLGNVKSPKVGAGMGCFLGLVIGFYFSDIMSIMGVLAFALLGGSLGGLSSKFKLVWKRYLAICTVGLILILYGLLGTDIWILPTSLIGLTFIAITLSSSPLFQKNGWILGSFLSLVFGHYMYNIVQQYYFNISDQKIIYRMGMSSLGIFLSLVLSFVLVDILEDIHTTSFSENKPKTTKIMILIFALIGSIIFVSNNFLVELSRILLDLPSYVEYRLDISTTIIIIPIVALTLSTYGIFLESWGRKKISALNREKERYRAEFERLLCEDLKIYYELKTKLSAGILDSSYKDDLSTARDKMLMSFKEINRKEVENAYLILKDIRDKLRMVL